MNRLAVDKGKRNARTTIYLLLAPGCRWIFLNVVLDKAHSSRVKKCPGFFAVATPTGGK
jgi:hypothetical protein